MARAKKHSIATLAALVAFVILSLLFIAVAITLQSDTKPLTTATRAAENCSDWCATASQCSAAGGRQVAAACSFDFCVEGTAPCLVGGATSGGRPEKSATCSAGKWKGEYCERTSNGFGTPPYCVRVDWNASCGDTYTRDDGLNCCSEGGSGGGAAAGSGPVGGAQPTAIAAQPTTRPQTTPFSAQTTVILPTSTRTPTPTVTPAAQCTNAAPYQTYQQCLFNCGAGAGNCTQQGSCYKCTMPTATPRPTTAQAQTIITQPVAFNTAVPQQQQPTQAQTQPGTGGQASADTCSAPATCTAGIAGNGPSDVINGQIYPDAACAGGQEELTAGRAYCAQQKGLTGVCCRARTNVSYNKPFTLVNGYSAIQLRVVQVSMRAETGLGLIGFNDFVGYGHTINPGVRYTYTNVNDICKKPGNSQATVYISVQYYAIVPGGTPEHYFRETRMSCSQASQGLTVNLKE